MPPTPHLLQLAKWLAPTMGGLMVVAVLLAPFDLYHYEVNYQPVSGREFLREAGVPFLAIGALLFAIGRGLQLERPWTRSMMLCFWILLGVAVFVFGVRDSGVARALFDGVVTAGLPLVVSWWYLYDKSNVVRYYRALEIDDA